MTGMDRRNLILGAATVSAAVSTGTLSACSPIDTEVTDLPGKFFGKVTVRRLVEAKRELAAEAALSLVTSEGAQLFSGRDDVAEAVHRLLNVEGFSMIGDSEKVAAGGFYWTSMGPWLCSDMVKGKAPQLAMDPCNDGFSEPVMNVLVGMNDAGAIGTILILENRRLSGQMASSEPPPPIDR